MDATDLDARFDRIMAAFDPPLIVVTAEVDGERSGCLVGFHCQCSISPRRHAVWISRANHTFGIATRAERLRLHVLGTGGHALAEVFGGTTGDEVDKWEVLDARGLELGAPWIDVRRVGLLDDGACDHVGLVVEPIEVDATGLDGVLRVADVDDVRPAHPA